MNLSEALAATQNHPPAGERAEMLREQLATFRRDFYGHLTDLKRFAAYEEKHDGDLPPGFAQAKATAEQSLGTIHEAIEATLAELKTLEPDA